LKNLRKIVVVFFLLGCLLAPALANQTYFDSRLTLPDLPGFQVFVQTEPDDKVKTYPQREARWSLNDKPTATTTRYLLANPDKNLWITLSLHETPYGGKESLSAQKFEKQFAPLLKKDGITVGSSKIVKSTKAGDCGYYLTKSDKAKGYATQLLYIPAASTGHEGDNRAFTIGVTYTKASSDQAVAIVQKILKNVEVHKK
jgi:hypothetical protein